ncbi:hypothetical protein M011DRAFT_398582 [Sporormia fimetaria CBS 119925]|uniref:C6 zinc finger domain-containing protein n=1 Tax=Sporormia fimetaria CBS 119925 TaxID=1340428 RepID=A0A6A6VFD9_9PLEO|nr:hypothetical protein M011DRAFT_398582 [Sporormia fimetaria CBS 119925]
MYNGRSLNYPADIPPATWMPYDSVPAYLTPGSPHLGDDYLSASAQFVPYQDFSRLSVYSVVSTATDSGSAYTPEPLHDCQSPMPDTSTTLYSYDRGLPDLDIPRNADNEAIDESSYPERSYWDDDSSCESMNWTDERNPSGPAFEKTAYYAKPVAIRIPKSLEPLPPLLLENKMNLIYFHHFLNHTARILVPHDCEQNPFRQILPEMAVRDENILHLLLAFSASHRARLLNHPEPANRIALWVQDVFPKLRASLDSSSTITNSTLAPALMMASLEIISPNTFEVPITWQKHLMVARQMIIARGGLQSIDRSDREAYFLCRWFVYLDVLGSLSGNRSDMPLGSLYWPSYEPDLQEDHQIDCLTGFTNRCIGLLARVAELARQCEYQRFDGDGNICEDWRPVPEVAQEAERLRKEMVDALVNPTAFDGCIHRTWENPDEASELYATNEMFHWAGLIHLYRRVLGLSATDPDVQYAVRSIVTLLREVRKAGTAEACLLFPMFTAGCDALDEEQRETIMDRLRCVEGFGIAQVHKARSLMQKVWDTGKPWESLASGEFFG